MIFSFYKAKFIFFWADELNYDCFLVLSKNLKGLLMFSQKRYFQDEIYVKSCLEDFLLYDQ